MGEDLCVCIFVCLYLNLSDIMIILLYIKSLFKTSLHQEKLIGFLNREEDAMTIEWEDFQKVELRVGTVVEVDDFPEARRPALKLRIDFGPELGILKSSAQITDLYNRENLLSKQVVAVTNFPPKQIGPHLSECLVTGFHREDGAVVLAVPDKEAPNGARLA